RAVESAAAHQELGLLRKPELDGSQNTLVVPLVHAGETRALRGPDLERGVLHAERPEDVILEVAVELLATRRLDHLARPVDVDAVLPLIAGVEHQRRGQRRVRAARDAGRVGGRLVLEDPRLPDLVGEARAVGEQVTERDRTLGRPQPRLARSVEALEDL